MALDVGDQRIGVAVASLASRLPQPHGVVLRSATTLRELQDIINREQVERVVVGLPRGLQGQDTAQTTKTRDFAKELADQLAVPIEFQDEALSSQRAETVLARHPSHKKGEVDALAASYILDDFLLEYAG